jgi:hypothetical protein
MVPETLGGLTVGSGTQSSGPCCGDVKQEWGGAGSLSLCLFLWAGLWNAQNRCYLFKFPSSFTGQVLIINHTEQEKKSCSVDFQDESLPYFRCI